MLALQGPIILEHRKTKKTLSQTEETEGNQTGSDRQTSELHETDRQTPEAPELSFLFAGNRKRFYSADTRLLLCILLWDAIGNPRRNINAGFWECKTQMMVVTCKDFNHPIVSKFGRPYTVMTQAISDQEKAQRRQPGP